MRSLRAVCAGGLLASLLALTGCGDSTTAEVSGTVKLGGNPVKAGGITFTPVDGKTATAGGEIKDGRYSARVPVGLMKVSITVSEFDHFKPLYGPKGPKMAVTNPITPPNSAPSAIQ